MRAALLVPVAALALVGCSGGEDRVAAPSTTTATAPVETTAPTTTLPGPQMATERPDVLPDPVAADGACRVAFDELRAVMEAYPSGLAAQQLPDVAAEMNAGIDAASACDAELLQEFMDVEFRPWMTWAAPDGYQAPGP